MITGCKYNWSSCGLYTHGNGILNKGILDYLMFNFRSYQDSYPGMTTITSIFSTSEIFGLVDDVRMKFDPLVILLTGVCKQNNISINLCKCRSDCIKV